MGGKNTRRGLAGVGACAAASHLAGENGGITSCADFVLRPCGQLLAERSEHNLLLHSFVGPTIEEVR